MQAEIFAERLEEVDQLLVTGTLTNKNVEMMREEIASKASVARAIMQNAIDYHMRNDEEVSQRLSIDLMVYSKIMTESLIARSQNK